ncbi:MAG TPA: hypothetical protein VNA25_29215 [Phycisphaerae bacterium]|nr:hypothetical protein [Phycisphaerae bacterium]
MIITDLIDWEQVALSVARNQVGPRRPVEELIADLGLTEHTFELLCEDHLFKRKVREFAKELIDNGSSFALKAQVQAVELLKTNYKIAKDPDTPPNVAVQAINSVVRWAGFDRRPEGDGNDGANRPKISINISLGENGPPTTRTIEILPTAEITSIETGERV